LPSLIAGIVDLQEAHSRHCIVKGEKEMLMSKQMAAAKA
jgi:hypothetical protein